MYEQDFPVENTSMVLWKDLESMMGTPYMRIGPQLSLNHAAFYPAFNKDRKEWRIDKTEFQLVGLSLFEMLTFFHFSDRDNRDLNIFSVSGMQIAFEFEAPVEEHMRRLFGAGYDPLELFTYEQSFSNTTNKNEIIRYGCVHLSKFLQTKYQLDFRMDPVIGQCYHLEKVGESKSFQSKITFEPLVDSLVLYLEKSMGDNIPVINATGYGGHINHKILECCEPQAENSLEGFGLRLTKKEAAYGKLVIFSANC